MVEHFFKFRNENYLNTLNPDNVNNNSQKTKASKIYNSAAIKNENEKNQNNKSLDGEKINRKRASLDYFPNGENKFNQNKKESFKIDINNMDNKMHKYIKKETKTIGNYNKLNSPLEN